MKLAVDGIFFDHVRKTGGTAIYEWLSDWLGCGRASPMFGLRPYAEVIKEFSDRALISGHCHFVPGDALDSSRLNLTVLRNPVDRVLSEYSYCRFDLPPRPGLPGSEFVRLARAKSLEEFIELRSEAVFNRISNEQARHFAPLGGYVNGSSALGVSRLAQLALRGFDMIGTQERLVAFAEVLGTCLGMSAERTAGFRRVNVSSRRLAQEDLDARIVARIERLNDWDCELYEAARALESEHLRAWGELAREFSAPVRIMPRSRGQATHRGAPQESANGTGTRGVEIVGVTVKGDISKDLALLSSEMVEICLRIRSDVDEEELTAGISIEDEAGRIAFATNTRLLGSNLGIRAGDEATVIFRGRLDIGNGQYFIGADVHRSNDHATGAYHVLDRAASVQVAGAIGSQFRGYARLHMSCSFDGLSASTIPMASSIALDTPCLANPVAGLEILSVPGAVRRNEVFTIDAVVRNLGEETWPAEGIRPIVLSYKWLDHATGNILVNDGNRTFLPRDIPAQDDVRMPVLVRAPATKGRLIAEIRVLQEHCTWFEAAVRVEIEIVQ